MQISLQLGLALSVSAGAVMLEQSGTVLASGSLTLGSNCVLTLAPGVALNNSGLIQQAPNSPGGLIAGGPTSVFNNWGALSVCQSAFLVHNSHCGCIR